MSWVGCGDCKLGDQTEPGVGYGRPMRRPVMQDSLSPAPLYVGGGDAARLVGVSPSTLRAWAEQGLVSPERTTSGYQRYTLADIERVQRLRRGQARHRIAVVA